MLATWQQKLAADPPLRIIYNLFAFQVYRYVFKGVDHGEILKNPESAEYVKRLIINITR
jgi:hypothetical protein